MVPREIFNDAAPCGAAHLLNNFGVSMQTLKRRCDRVDISRLHDDSFDAIAHHVAGLTRSDI